MGFKQLHTLLLILALITVSCIAFSDTIGVAKRDYADDTHVLIQGSVIANLPGSMYIESSDMCQGIRVDTSKTFAEGTMVFVGGLIKTDPSNNERYILPDASYPLSMGTTLNVKPRGMTPAVLTGGDFGYQRGISDSFDLNNIGMLVKVCGPVTSYDDPVHPTNWFKINETAGPAIKVVVPSGVSIDIDWTQVTVTGISSMEIVNGVASRVIKVRYASDITNYVSWADNKVATLTLDQKVGQMFVYKFTGTTVTSTIISQIQSQHVGGYCISQANSNMPSVTGTANLTNSLQTYAMNGDGIPLLISTDQEGGYITRLNPTNGGTPFPGNMSVGASQSYDAAFTTGATLGSEIKAIGIDMNNAPDLDCNTNPDNPVIGVRSFGEDPTNTANMGHGYLDGLRSVGCISTGKHFPGHGDTSTDSHTGLPVVTYPYSTLNSIHGKPFRDCTGYGIDCIMTAHVLVTCLDSVLPATLSPTVLNGYLRGAIAVPGVTPIGFNGVCITDSMGMGALASLGYTNDQECAMALEAGNDLVLWPNNLTTAISAVKSAVTSGALPESEVNKKVARILRLKRKYGLFSNPYVDVNAAISTVGSAAHKASELDVARAGVTLVTNNGNILPIHPTSASQVYIVAAGSASSSTFASCFTAKLGTKPGYYGTGSNPTSSNITTIKNNAANATWVIIATYDAGNNSGQQNLVTQLISAGKKVICVGTWLPYEFYSITNCNAYLCTYMYNTCNLQAAADVIVGDYHPTGKLPVSIPGTSYNFGWGLGF